MERNIDDIFDSLQQYFFSIGFKKKGRSIFVKEFVDGYWFINRLIDSKKKVVKISYQIGFHLYEIEKIAADLEHRKYKLNSITGTCNLGHLFNVPVYYEQLIDSYITEEDILFDVSYHINRYVIPIFNKYNNLNSFKNSMIHSNELSNFNINFFSNIALYIVARDFESALKIIEQSKCMFKDENEKKSCVSLIKSME